ncbi:RagB/SusD family nutrient uptake outer membrane protein [Sphingobacterium daejeonense]|uniref:RagB/SusD family nutrient uptake outer membrane protein n=1 Tax=Sphingobacterium daejeonense TaxID=371142 RepID=A0ABW3RK85_9SPHI
MEFSFVKNSIFQYGLIKGNKGFVDVVDKVGQFEEPKYYYRPIPQNDVNLNNSLKQIFGW